MRDKITPAMIFGIIGSAALLVAMFFLFKEFSFRLNKNSGKYTQIEATIIGHDSATTTSTSHSHGSRRSRTRHRRTKKRTSYYTIYSYEENGVQKEYTSPEGTDTMQGQVGDTVILYKNKKTGRIREDTFKTTIPFMAGIAALIFYITAWQFHKKERGY